MNVDLDALRKAAVAHAETPRGADGRPVVPTDLVTVWFPDDQRVTTALVEAIYEITGVRVEWWSGATYIMAARCRATLSRWVVKTYPITCETRRRSADTLRAKALADRQRGSAAH